MKRFWEVSRRLLCVGIIACLLLIQIPAMAVVSGSSTMAKYGAKYIVTASRLNLRAGPSTDYPIITSMKKGTEVTYLDYHDGWWLVQLSPTKAGYVDKKYLTPASVSKTGKYFVTASELCIRKDPRTSGRLLGTVKKGTMVTITQLNGDWGYVSGGAEVKGWVALKYVSTKNNVSSGGKYVVTASKLNVRSGASTSRERIDSVPYGAVVQVTQTNGDWGKISYTKNGAAKSGWVKLDYLRAR